MGLTKQYLTYRPRGNFNIIVSGRSNVNFIIYNGLEGRYIAVAAAEDVIIWDLRLEERIITLHRSDVKTQEVTALRAAPDHIHLAVGYADGVVEIFDLVQSTANRAESVCSLTLHKSAISILRYDDTGTFLVSGGLDNDLVVVDVVEQAGQHRLTGHKAAITDAHFYNESIIVSSSKDTQIKFWNIQTEICFKTIVDMRTEVWGLGFTQDFLVAGCGESTLFVYRIVTHTSADTDDTINRQIAEGGPVDEEKTFSAIGVLPFGVIQRTGKGRCVNMVIDESEHILSCHGINYIIENFYICDEKQSKERLLRRIKKAKKEQKKTAGSTSEQQDENEDIAPIDYTYSVTDYFIRLPTLRMNGKIKSFDLVYNKQKSEFRVLVALANNSVQMYNMNVSTLEAKITQSTLKIEYKLLRSLKRHGHQSEVRTVCFSSDSLAIGSAAGESFKIWNRERQLCLRTAVTDYVLCSMFAPGDRYVLLGLKSGKLLIVDVGLGETVEEIPAHEKELWSVVPLPDKRGCITGSSDATVKIWSYALIDAPIESTVDESSKTSNDKDIIENNSDGIDRNRKVLSLLHNNTLKFKESVLCVQVSADLKYLAVGLLDATAQVFFLDTFKFFLSLYGHKMPVLCLDICYDSTLIVTGSADRNVKIWGLDFGDCHRSLFAHDDSVMSVQFIPKTHMFFTCGKDGQIKQWDADNFEKILTLPGHLGEAYNLAVSPNGEFLVSCGSDRTLRLYQRTDEILVLEDAQEEEREQAENQQLATGSDQTVPLLPGIKLAFRKTVGAEKAVESILECLHIYKQLEKDLTSEISSDDVVPVMLSLKRLPEKTLHPLMRALNVNNTNDFLVSTLDRIRSSDLKAALLLLPFASVCELLERMLPAVIHRNDELELLFRVVAFLFKIHSKALVRAHHLKPTLKKILATFTTDVQNLRDDIGHNLYTLTLIQNELNDHENIELFRESVNQKKKTDKRKREHEKSLKSRLIVMT